MSIESIGAIQQCMDDLGIRWQEQNINKVSATLRNNRTQAIGTVDVTFNSNWHSGDGPYVEVGDEIRGFGIPYEVFKPQFIDITYNGGSKQLEFSHKAYNFTLQFKTE